MPMFVKAGVDAAMSGAALLALPVAELLRDSALRHVSPAAVLLAKFVLAGSIGLWAAWSSP